MTDWITVLQVRPAALIFSQSTMGYAACGDEYERQGSFG